MFNRARPHNIQNIKNSIKNNKTTKYQIIKLFEPILNSINRGQKCIQYLAGSNPKPQQFQLTNKVDVLQRRIIGSMKFPHSIAITLQRHKQKTLSVAGL